MLDGTTVVKSIRRYKGNTINDHSDTLIAESAVGVKVNNKALVTLLCSPEALDDLAVGFLQSEGLLSKRRQLIGVEVNEEKAVVNVIAEIDDQQLGGIFIRRKPVYTSGCCQGITFREFEENTVIAASKSSVKVTPSNIYDWVKNLRSQAQIFSCTGAAHMSGLVIQDEFVSFREDIGRHNSLDKVFGNCFLREIDLTNAILVTSGRLSGEMVMKCAMRQVPIIVSSGVATYKAVEIAERNNLTLIGYVRNDTMNVYTNNWRLVE